MKKPLLVLIILIFAMNIAVAQETIFISSPVPTALAKIENGAIVGPYIDIMNIIFNEFGIKVKTVPLPWARAIEYLKTGEIDAITPIFYTDERSRFMEFSTFLDSVDTVVFTKKGKFDDFRTWNDLKGHRGIVVRGRSEGRKFDDYAAKNLNLEVTNSLRQVIQMLIFDRGDYGIDKYYDTIAESIKLELYEKIQFMPVSISTNENLIGISQKSPFLNYLPQVNEKIKQLKQEGTIRKLLINHLNEIAAE